jgi:hypothetical protein
MNQTNRSPNKPSRSKRVAVIAAMVVLFAVMAVSVYANAIYWLATDQNGTNYFLSCGSSAGDYYYKCDANNFCEEIPEASPGAAHQGCIDHGYYLPD